MKTPADTLKSIHGYLLKYYKYQDKIMLVYHPTPRSDWSTRCMYLSEEYNDQLSYNHRGILHNEVVIEYDNKDPKVNEEYINQIRYRLNQLKMPYMVWESGGKSIHLHQLLDVQDAKNMFWVKKAYIAWLTAGLPSPDSQLLSDNHLIRAEFGLHEKTGKPKTLLFRSKNYFDQLTHIPEEVWEKYTDSMEHYVQKQIITDLSELTKHPGVEYILNSPEFKDLDDGRERALFFLIHVLKTKFKEDKEGLIQYLQEWYKYSGGNKLSDASIAGKVHYHWNKHYDLTENYINTLLIELGKPELVWKQPQ
jgi:hypothetical protein